MKKYNICKILIGVVIVSLSLLTIIFLNELNNNSYMDKLNSMENSTTATWMIYANSVEELIDLSDIIIEGKVVNYKPRIHDGIVFTDETVEVRKVIKGDVTKGDNITVVFTGGEIEGIITPPIKDCPIMDIRGNYMLFLKTNNGKDYFIIGGNQGFGLIKDNRIETTEKGGLEYFFSKYKLGDIEKSVMSQLTN